MSDEKPDFDSIRRNAQQQGIPLSEIAIFYCELTSEEVDEMVTLGLMTHRGSNSVIGKFMPDGSVKFPDKATGVHYLAGD